MWDELNALQRESYVFVVDKTPQYPKPPKPDFKSILLKFNTNKERVKSEICRRYLKNSDDRIYRGTAELLLKYFDEIV